MIKEIKLEDITPVADLKNKLWESLNLLRGSVGADDFNFILFFLTLQRNGLLSEIELNYQDDLKNKLFKSILKLDGENSYNFKDIFRVFEPSISRVENDIIYELIRLFTSFNQIVLNEYFPDIFDDLLYKLARLKGKYGGESIQPLELSRFICMLAELPPDAKVYNPFAGLASFGVVFENGVGYFGQEQIATTWAIASLRIMAYGKENSTRLIHENSIRSWNPSAVRYDLIVATPPFGMRLPDNYSGKFGIIRTGEHFLIENGIKDLKPTGKLIAVLPQRFLFSSGSERNLRQFLVENDLLEMIISFPVGLFLNTGIPFAVIVINKHKKEHGFVRFIEAKEFVETISKSDRRLNDIALNEIAKSNIESESLRIVANSTIAHFDFNLSVPRYFTPEIEIDRDIKLENLGGVLSVVHRQRNSTEPQGKFIRIRDLKDDRLDYQLDLNSIEQVDLPGNVEKIMESCLLIATRWKSLKPTYVHYSGEPIFITPDTIALKVDETKVDINYLINELYSTYVNEQIVSYRLGTAIPYIRREDLFRIKIYLPSIQEQRAKVKGVKEVLLYEKKKELDLLNKLHGFEEDIYNQNSFLRHTIAGPLRNLRSSFKSIKSIIENQIVQNIPELMLLKEKANSELDFGKYLEIMERDLKIVSENTRRNGLDEDSIQDYILEPMDFFTFLENYILEVRNRENLIFEIDFKYEKDSFEDEEGNRTPIFINGNADLLRNLFNNLIENAEKHAFELTKKKGNKIEIDVMPDYTADAHVHLLFSNNGKPFPQNFSQEMFIKKGSKTGINGGNGFGGWYINEIMKKHKGYFEILDPENELITESYPISFYFEFPLTTE